MRITVDLNCDVGEQLGPEAEILPRVSSANIACGAHAGDERTMRHAARAAVRLGLAIGAHVGLDDREHFGRRELDISPADAYQLLRRQVLALRRIVHEEGGTLHHVKPHGALYNMAARYAVLTDALVAATKALGAELVFYGLSGSEMIRVARGAGLAAASEVYADRAYQGDGSLRPRNLPGALIVEPERAADQVMHMLREGSVRAFDGTRVPVVAETICVHADTPAAPAILLAIRRRLAEAAVDVRPA